MITIYMNLVSLENQQTNRNIQVWLGLGLPFVDLETEFKPDSKSHPYLEDFQCLE